LVVPENSAQRRTYEEVMCEAGGVMRWTSTSPPATGLLGEATRAALATSAR
jgi:hypothetical protein